MAEIEFPTFKPRWYQLKVFKAMEEQGYRKFILVWSRRCLSGLTHITMADGSYKLLKDITPGDLILSWNGKEFVSDTVKDSWKTDVKQTSIVQSPRFLPLITSNDHVFATTYCTGRTYLWQKLKEIGQYRLLLNYAGMALLGEHNPELAEFYGYLLADGYVVGYQQPKFTNNNQAILERVHDLAIKLFGVTVKIRPKGNGFDLGLSNGTKGGATSNPIKDLFRKDGLDVPKKSKRLPPILWRLDEQSIGRYFAGLISADGNIYCHKKGFVGTDNAGRTRSVPPSVEVSIHCGQSYELAYDIYWLLRKMGIQPQVPKKEKESNWKLRVSKGVDVSKLLSYGRIYGKEEQQQAALEVVKDRTFKASRIDGCYRSKFTIKSHTQEVLYDLETDKNHNFIANGYVVHNSGKDFTAWQLAIRTCLTKVCAVYYALPTLKHARAVIWEGIAVDGRSFLSFIPKELIKNLNGSELSIKFINGSILRLIGANRFDNIVIGTNVYGLFLSEAAKMDNLESIIDFFRPIIALNGGFIFMQSTPRGKGPFYWIYQQALENPDWYVSFLTARDTKHIPEEVITKEESEMNPETFAQEYLCSFERGQLSLVYGNNIDKMMDDGRYTIVNHDPNLLTHIVMDLGMRKDNTTCLLFFQVPDSQNFINIIDCYSSFDIGLDTYSNLIKKKVLESSYTIGTVFMPHDAEVRELSDARTRQSKFRALGWETFNLPQRGQENSIDLTASIFQKLWINSLKCKPLMDALENYRREWQEERRIYTEPIHNWASNYCFVGETNVLTHTGLRQIMDIQDNDYVLTLEGWKRCMKSIKTKMSAQLVEVKFQDATIVKCTPDHLFLTENGWISAGSLQKNTKILSSWMSGCSILMDESLDSMPIKNILWEMLAIVQLHCIDMFGDSHLGKSQLEYIFTILMEMPLITIYSIYNVYQTANIEKFQSQIARALVMFVDALLINGTDQRLVELGIAIKHKLAKDGKAGNANQENVNGVKKIFNVWLEKVNLNKNGAIKIAKLQLVENVEKLSERNDVYCFSVPTTGHFSLFNGAIVKNCDALKYLACSLEYLKPKRSLDEINRVKRQALYGNNRRFPDQFRK